MGAHCGSPRKRKKDGQSNYRHAVFYRASLYCASQTLHFLQTEGLWQPCIKQVYQHHFSNIICSLHVSVSRLVILSIFQTFHYDYQCYGDPRSVISDVTIVIVLGHQESCPYKMANVTDKRGVCSPCSPCSLPLLRPPYSETQEY